MTSSVFSSLSCNTPLLIDRRFQHTYSFFNSSTAILYNDQQPLHQAMVQALSIDLHKLKLLRSSISELRADLNNNATLFLADWLQG
jgi:hypothetical protein